jgi:uncharacterized phiE125 gp8 family phage protein
MTTVEILSPAPTLPVTLAEFKAHSKITTTAEDSLLPLYLGAAVRLVEDYIERCCVETTVRQTTDGAPSIVRLHRSPVIAVDDVESIEEGGSWTAVPSGSYYVHADRLVFTSHSFRSRTFAGLRIDYRCGYYDLPASPTETDLANARAAVPAPIRAAILETAAFLHENREGDSRLDTGLVSSEVIAMAPLPAQIRQLLAPYRKWGV